MARESGVFQFPANFEVEKAGPLDARQVCELLTDMYGLRYTFPGMIAVVTGESNAADNGIYVMQNQIDPDVDGTSSDWALASGGAGNPVTDFTYDDATGELKITLDDGTEHTVTIISSGGDYDPIVADTTTMTEAVGGIDNGTTAGELAGKSYNEMWDLLLFPTAYPTLTAPSISLSNTIGLQEVGAEIDTTVNPGVSLGAITNGWNGTSQGTRSDEMTSAELSWPASDPTGTLDIFDAGSFSQDPYPVTSYVVQLGSSANTWTLDVSVSTGPQPVDSKGNSFDSPYGGGTFQKTTNFEGVYPIYLGLSTGNGNFEKRSEATENTTDGIGLVSHSGGTISISQNYGDNASATRHRIAVPSSFGSITIQERNFSTNTWGASSWSSGSSTNFTVNTTTGPIAYTVYEKTGSSSGGDSMFSGSLKSKYRIIF